MGKEFTNFIEKRFGYNTVTASTTATADQESISPTSVTTEETPISDTLANRAFMDRFCRVN